MLLSVILPVHNEEEIIRKTFSEIYKTVKKTTKDSEFILVENGSIDKTLEVARVIGSEYPNCKIEVSQKGYGRAIIEGISKARGEYICYMPSDGQVDMKAFPKLWNLAIKNTWEIVKVKRSNRENFNRKLVSISFSFFISFLFGTKIIDVNGSPRILKKRDIDILDLHSKDSFIDAEMLIKASKLKWMIKEIPMVNLDRVGGKSTRSIKTFVEFFSNIYKYKTGKNLSKWMTSRNKI